MQRMNTDGIRDDPSDPFNPCTIDAERNYPATASPYICRIITCPTCSAAEVMISRLPAYFGR